MPALADAFSDPDTHVVDVVRVVGILAGIVMLGLFLKVARQVRNTRQYGMYALVCFGISAIGTQIEYLGDPATYKLIPNTAGVILGCVFLVKTAAGERGGRRGSDRGGSAADRRAPNGH